MPQRRPFGPSQCPRKADVIDMPDELAADVAASMNNRQQIGIESALLKSSQARSAERGVNSDGFTTTALPASNAGMASATLNKNG